MPALVVKFIIGTYEMAGLFQHYVSSSINRRRKVKLFFRRCMSRVPSRLTTEASRLIYPLNLRCLRTAKK